MKTLLHSHPAARRQRGISLMVVTVMLLAIILMTVTAFYVSRTQYKLVGNIQASELAFGQAEGAIAAAEVWLNVSGNSQSTSFETYNSTITPHLYPIGQMAALGYSPTSMTWSDSNSLVSGNARYLIEQVGKNVHKPGDSISLGQKSTGCKAVDLFRVAARSESGQGGARIIETIEAVSGC